VPRIRLRGLVTVNPEPRNEIDVAYFNRDNGGSSFGAVVAIIRNKRKSVILAISHHSFCSQAKGKHD
jgi:hypothetical protein